VPNFRGMDGYTDDDSDMRCARLEDERDALERAHTSRIAKLDAKVAELERERDRERLRYGRAAARNASFMQAMAYLARNGMEDKAKAWVKSADAAALNVRLEDFTVARVAPTPTPEGGE